MLKSQRLLHTYKAAVTGGVIPINEVTVVGEDY